MLFIVWKIKNDDEFKKKADEYGIAIKLTEDATKITTVGNCVRGEVTTKKAFETYRKRIYGTTMGYQIVELSGSETVSREAGEKAIIVFGNKFAKQEAEKLINKKWKPSLSLKYMGDIFEEILTDVEVDPTPVASLLAYDLREIKREGLDIDILTTRHLKDIFQLLADSKIAKDSVTKLTTCVIQSPDEEIEITAKNNNLTLLSHEEVTQIIEDIVNKNEAMVKERQMGAMGPLMGMSMKELKGKADGSIVNRIVKESIQKML